MRSTASLAMRRQVVSLPPVIVTIPLDVSYSSALREMSTDFLGSPVEISGRTPANAPATSPGSSAVAKNALTASSRYATSSSAGRRDRAAHHRERRARQHDVGAAARADDRHLGLVVELVRAQPVGPHAGG